MGEAGTIIGSTLVWRPDAAGTSRAFTAVEWCDPGQGGVQVADSFRVVAGRVRGIDYHRARFVTSAASGDGGRSQAEAFWADAIAVLRGLVEADPQHPPLFPRVERRERGEYRLLVRPSPAVHVGAGLATAVIATAGSDPRHVPQTKGPDLERLAGLRTQVQSCGADEAVIVDARGHVIEGAYSSLLVARGGRLGVVAQPAPRIPSVTERLVRDAARTEGLTVDEVTLAAAELSGASLWLMSALHGARAVSAWVDGPTLHRDVERDSWLRETLESAAVPL